MPRFAPLALTLLLLPPTTLAAHAQPAWRDLAIPVATEQARAEHKPVLLLFTAPGCLACHRMDAIVWPDADLAAWIDEHTITVRVPLESLDDAMAALHVTGFPTMLRLEDSVETARLVGYRPAADLLAWLKDPAALDPPEAGTIVGVGLPLGDLYDKGVDLLLAGQPSPAARALAEFWTRSAVEPGVTPTLRWIRRDRLPSMLAKLCEDPGARAALEELLEGFPATGPGPTDPDTLVSDWISLSRALNHLDALDAWIDTSLHTQDGLEQLRSQRGAFDRLTELDRWADAGRIASPAMWSRWVARLNQEPTGDPVSDAMPSIAIEKERERAPEQIERFVRALRAAGRSEDADKLESTHE